MEEVNIIGVDLANYISQLHGASADGTVVFLKNSCAQKSPRY